jgi:hypothetical protein
MQSRVADELGILWRITDETQSTIHPGRNHVVTLQDSFELASKNKNKNILTSLKKVSCETERLMC